MTTNESFERLHILLVDDSIVNQKVIAQILKKNLGGPDCSVEIADSGEQALKILGIGDGGSPEEGRKFRARFDLILMDVHMMGINGLEVTRIIREEEKAVGCHIPIIGMTASIKGKDKEKCLKAGMDFYLTKPISAKDLLETIDNLLKGQILTSPKKVQSEVSESKTEGLPINLEMAYSIVDGNIELLKKMVSRVMSFYPMEIEEMQRALSDSNVEQLNRAAHRLKGSIGMIGAEKTYELADRLEEIDANEEPDEAKTVLALLTEELERVKQFVSEPGWEKQRDNENINC
ncbi:MAG: response regulator [bacterium]